MATTKTSPLARKIALECYPDYKGRKIRVESRETYTMADYWDGGSRSYALAYNLETGFRSTPNVAANVPFEQLAHARFAIPSGYAIVEHSIFCGKDAGITVYVNPAADKAGLLVSH